MKFASSASYRACQISALIELAAWTIVGLSLLCFPDGHPSLGIIFLILNLPLSTLAALTGFLFGGAALTVASLRRRTIPFLIIHTLLLLVSLLLPRYCLHR